MYDSKKQYWYNCPHSISRGKPVTELHRFSGDATGMPWRGVIEGCIVAFSDNDPRLVEVDEVVGYRNVYGREVSWHFDTLAGAIAPSRSDESTVGRFAVHASGRVRNIPLDATTDPEGNQ
jgi:hypothetical protein